MNLAESAVATQMTFSASPAKAWEGLMFFEEIEQPPPFHLRMMLPVPIRTVGKKDTVGDEARCLYEGGHLIKRITRVDPGVHYHFDVIEQELPMGGGLKLSGGGYTLRQVTDGSTEVTLATRYVSARRPRWFWQPVESFVCHSFHRHILAQMRKKLEGSR